MSSLAELEREPLCSVDFCPAPSDPHWHVCRICGTTKGIQHHHVRKGQRIALCFGCQERITLNEWRQEVVEDKFGNRWWFVQDRHGKTLARHTLDTVPGAGAISRSVGVDTSTSIPASSLMPKQEEGESHADGRERQGWESQPVEVQVTEAGGPDAASGAAGPPEWYRDAVPAPAPVTCRDDCLNVHEWGAELKRVARAKTALSLRLALLLHYGIERFDEEAWQYVSEAGLQRHTVENALAVVRAFGRERLESPRGEMPDYEVLREIAPIARRDAEAGEKLLAWVQTEHPAIEVLQARKREIRGVPEPEYSICPTCGTRVRERAEWKT